VRILIGTVSLPSLSPGACGTAAQADRGACSTISTSQCGAADGASHAEHAATPPGREVIWVDPAAMNMSHGSAARCLKLCAACCAALLAAVAVLGAWHGGRSSPRWLPVVAATTAQGVGRLVTG